MLQYRWFQWKELVRNPLSSLLRQNVLPSRPTSSNDNDNNRMLEAGYQFRVTIVIITMITMVMIIAGRSTTLSLKLLAKALRPSCQRQWQQKRNSRENRKEKQQGLRGRERTRRRAGNFK